MDMVDAVGLDTIRNALNRPRKGSEAQARMAPPGRMLSGPDGSDPRMAAVLVLLYPGPGGLWLVLTKRSEGLSHHGGQVSLPGGGWEEGDLTLMDTAIREAAEELGIEEASIEIIAPLTPNYIPPSNNLAHPFVGYCRVRPEFRMDDREVSELIEVPLTELLEPGNMIQNSDDSMPHFLVQGLRVWGATAMILSELVDALSAAME